MSRPCDKRHKCHEKSTHRAKCESMKCDTSTQCNSIFDTSCVSTCEAKCNLCQNYIFAYNTTGFTYPTTTNFTTVPFDTVNVADGWTLSTISGVSFFTCPKTAVYKIEYNVTVQNVGGVTGGGEILIPAPEQDVIFRLFRNNIPVAGSNSWASVERSDQFELTYVNGNSIAVKPTFTEIAAGILVSLNAGDKITLATAGTLNIGVPSTLSLPTSIALLNLTGLEPAKIAIIEVS